MSKKQTVAMSDLQKMLIKYRDILEHAEGKTKRFDDEGNLIKVKDGAVDNAFKKLRDAELAVSDVCEQAVLAIQVEP